MSDNYIQAMREFTSTAKSCVTLSTSALVIPITVLKAAYKDDVPLGIALYSSWAFLAASVICGLLYQVKATNLIAERLNMATSSVAKYLNAVFLYNAMIVGLCLGLFCLMFSFLPI